MPAVYGDKIVFFADRSGWAVTISTCKISLPPEKLRLQPIIHTITIIQGLQSMAIGWSGRNIAVPVVPMYWTDPIYT